MELEPDFIAGLIVVVAVLFFILLLFGESSQMRQKERTRKALSNYKVYIAQRRKAALRNYETEQRKQRQLIRQRQGRRLMHNISSLLQDAFPEMADPQQRGTIVRALVLHLLQSVLTGKGLSTQWDKQMHEFVNDVDGVFAMKQELKRWYKKRQAEISQNFESGQINEEEMESELEELATLYQDALQEIQFS